MLFQDVAYFQNPREVINEPLPDLLAYTTANKVEIETTSESSLKFTFRGTLAPWPDFQAEALNFYNKPETKNAFNRCKLVKTDLDAAMIEAVNANFEHLSTYRWLGRLILTDVSSTMLSRSSEQLSGRCGAQYTLEARNLLICLNCRGASMLLARKHAQSINDPRAMNPTSYSRYLAKEKTKRFEY